MRLPRTRLATVAVAGVLSLGLAACGGGGDDGGGTADGEADVSLLGTDALKFEPDTLSAEAGEIAVELTAEPAVNHDFVIDGGESVVEVGAGETAVGTVELDAGEYTFYCSVPGHREAGMEGTLTVE